MSSVKLTNLGITFPVKKCDQKFKTKDELSNHLRKHEQVQVVASTASEEFVGCIPKVKLHNEIKHDNFDRGIEEDTSDIENEVVDDSEFSSSSTCSSKSDTESQTESESREV